jgi:hypothetical protein
VRQVFGRERYRLRRLASYFFSSAPALMEP